MCPGDVLLLFSLGLHLGVIGRFFLLRTTAEGNAVLDDQVNIVSSERTHGASMME